MVKVFLFVTPPSSVHLPSFTLQPAGSDSDGYHPQADRLAATEGVNGNGQTALQNLDIKQSSEMLQARSSLAPAWQVAQNADHLVLRNATAMQQNSKPRFNNPTRAG